jgi:hypothetical protein
MNYRQRAYESYDQSNMNKKIANSYFHIQNIKNIFFRKPQFYTIKKEYSPKSKKIKIKNKPTQNYFLIRENELYKKIINGISSPKAKPKINTFHEEREEKLREYRRQNRTLENRKLVRENTSFKKRIKNQKSLLRIKDIEKDYKENHLKMVQRLKKKRTTFLPPINDFFKMKRYESPKNNRIRNKSGRYDISSLNGSSSIRKGESPIRKQNYYKI